MIILAETHPGESIRGQSGTSMNQSDYTLAEHQPGENIRGQSGTSMNQSDYTLAEHQPGESIPSQLTGKPALVGKG